MMALIELHYMHVCISHAATTAAHMPPHKPACVVCQHDSERLSVPCAPGLTVTCALQVAAAQLGAAKQLGPLRALHFRPSGWPHAVTAVLPLPPTASAAAEDALQGRRLQLHRRLSAFLLPPSPLQAPPASCRLL